MSKTKTSGAKNGANGLSAISPVTRLEYFLQDIADRKSSPTKTPVRRSEEFLKRISKTTANIPTDPTAEDVGKVWTAGESGGEWAEAGGGGSPLVKIGCTTITPGLEWRLNMTYPEIKALISEGKIPYIYLDRTDPPTPPDVPSPVTYVCVGCKLQENFIPGEEPDTSVLQDYEIRVQGGGESYTFHGYTTSDFAVCNIGD